MQTDDPAIAEIVAFIAGEVGVDAALLTPDTPVAELGISSLREIEAIRLPMGLRIERDIAFTTRHRLSVWTEAARFAGSIPDAALLLDRLTREVPSAIRLLPR